VVADREAVANVLVSNLRPVSAVVTVQEPASASAGGEVELMIRELPGHRPVDARVYQTGTSADSKKTEYDLKFELPPDPESIESSARRKVRRAEESARARASRPGESDLTLRYLQEHEANAVTALKQAYHGSRPGVFEVIAVYRVERRGIGVATIRSEPARFEVVNDGEYFEQPAFR
jgi:hypothetical protein